MTSPKTRRNHAVKLLDEASTLGRVEFLKVDEAAKVREGLMAKIDTVLDELFRLRRSKESRERACVYEAIRRIATMQDKLSLQGRLPRSRRNWKF